MILFANVKATAGVFETAQFQVIDAFVGSDSVESIVKIG